jgi:dipeptidyl-peptidase-4
MIITKLLSAAAVLGLGSTAVAQTNPNGKPLQPLTLERVFAAPALSGPVPRMVKLSPDGRLATLLRNRPDDVTRYDLWAIDPATAQMRMLVDSKRVGSGAELSEAARMQQERARTAGIKGIVSYDWSPDGKSILVPLDGDVYLAGLDGQVRRLTETKDSELDATVSETGRFVSFVANNELHVINLASGRTAKVTDGASETVSWGLAEFIAQEEMRRFRGHWWSPDDKRIAVARVDETGVEVATRAAIGAEKTTVVQQRYARTGTDNAKVELYLMNPDGSGRVKADLGSDPDIYLARVDWLPKGDAVIVQRQSRDQKRLDYLRVDARTGASTPLFSDTSAVWINLSDDLKPLADGSLIFSSERSGYRHLYRWAKGKLAPLTSGNWVVTKVVGLDEKGGKLFFTSNRETSIEHQLYVLDYDRKGARPVLITRPGSNHDVDMDESGRLAVITASSSQQPAQVWLADTTGKRLAWIGENRIGSDHPFAPYFDTRITPQYGRLTAADGKTQLDYRLVLPPGLKERGGRAPVWMMVYAGPGTQDVQNGFAGALGRYLVQEGWILFQVGNRGQEGRGTAFSYSINRALGGVEVADQLAGLRWLKAQPFVAADKVTVNGWSYGGYMVLKLLQAAPGAFAAGIAGAPVTRWELYDTHYTERYLGDPRKDPEAYAKASALTEAARIKDPLLLVHGMSDDNVLFQNSTELMAKLQEAKVPFEVMVYPGKTHVMGGPNIFVHQYGTMLRFLERNGTAPVK